MSESGLYDEAISFLFIFTVRIDNNRNNKEKAKINGVCFIFYFFSARLSSWFSFVLFLILIVATWRMIQSRRTKKKAAYTVTLHTERIVFKSTHRFLHDVSMMANSMRNLIQWVDMTAKFSPMTSNVESLWVRLPKRNLRVTSSFIVPQRAKKRAKENGDFYAWNKRKRPNLFPTQQLG